VRYFGKNDSDRIEDFSDGVSLEEYLTRPYRTSRPPDRATSAGEPGGGN
jgi:hypothetical protein